jgi:hypothetical protein
VNDAVFSPDGRRIAAGGNQGRVSVWDVTDGRRLLSFAGHRGAVMGVAFSPDGSRLASTSFDTTVRLWDLRSGKELLILHPARNAVSRILFSADGDRLLAWTPFGEPLVWDAGGNALDRPAYILPRLDRRLAADPKDRDTRRARASLLASRGEWERAAADCAVLAELAGRGDPPWIDLGWWLGRAGDADAKASPPAGPGAVFRRADPDVNGRFDLGTLPDAYAVTWLFVRGAPRRQAVLAARLNPRLWLNGQVIHEGSERLGARTPPVRLVLPLREGWNTLVASPLSRTEGDFLDLRLSEEPFAPPAAMGGTAR